MSFFNPWGFLGLLGIPLVILIYILKETNRDIKVPSTFLWKKAVASLESKKPWQKLRRNILMLLQILIVLIITFALSNPYIKGSNNSSHYILVLDSSISMASSDVLPTRFEHSKKEIKKIIDNAPKNTYFTLVSAKKDSNIIIENTSERNTVKNLLNNMKLEFESMDINSTLDLLKNIKTKSNGSIYFFTDYNIKSDIISDMQVVLVKNSDENVGISFASENNGNLLVKLVNNSEKDETRTLTLYNNNDIIDVYDVNISGNENKDMYLNIDSNDINILKLVISPEDNYKYDDEYYYTLNHSSNKKAILFSDNNIFIEKVLSVMPNIELYKGEKNFIDKTNGYSLYIYDGVLPEKLPNDGHIMIFSPPKENNILNVIGEKDVNSNITISECELTKNIDDIDFVISNAKNIEMPLWGNTFMKSDELPIAFYGVDNSNKIVVFGFDIHDTDIPLKIEFPIIMYNCIDYFFPERSINIENIFTKDIVNIDILPDTKEAYILKPSKEKIIIAPPFPADLFSDTNENGIYKIFEYNENKISNESVFAVNIVRDFNNNVTLNENIDYNNINKKDYSIDKNIIGILIFIILIVLVLEWWVNCHEN